VTLGLHATWFVNSATHMWGSRRFDTRDDSRNNWWVALLTGGEGWHNNHHAHPVSARHGLAWYEFDLNYYGIWIMGQLGLAKKINALTIAQTTIGLPELFGNTLKSLIAGGRVSVNEQVFRRPTWLGIHYRYGLTPSIVASPSLF
jgi:hypothetical protein